MSKVRWLSAVAGTAIFVGAFALPGTGVAYAATSDGPLSILSGNTANAPVNIPATLCGVTVSLLGGSSAQCDGSSSTSTRITDPSGPAAGGSGPGGVRPPPEPLPGEAAHRHAFTEITRETERTLSPRQPKQASKSNRASALTNAHKTDKT